MIKQLNYKITIYLRLIGAVGLSVQLVQFFNGLWAFDTSYEIFMLLLTIALALNPSKYLDKIIDAVAKRIGGGNNQENYNDVQSVVGGEGVDTDEEV